MKPPLDEDPYVAPVEQVLGAHATWYSPARNDRKPVATHALWICACVCDQDAPVWLIYRTVDDGLRWCRVPDRVEALDLVDAQRYAGGHTSPYEVLMWLQGEVDDPSGVSDWVDGDPDVLQSLRSRIQPA